MTVEPSNSTLQTLVEIAVSSVSTLESIYQAHGASFPSLDLIATVCPPNKHHTNLDGGGMYVSAGLQYIVETSIPDIMKEGDPKVMHVDEIASKINVPTEANGLARVLRFLATHHIFREVTPNVFAHNRTSSMFCKAKTLKEIRDDPVTQYNGLTSTANLGHCLDEGLRSAAHLSAWLQAPKGSIRVSPFLAAFKVDDIWRWFEQPGNELRRNRFGSLMSNTQWEAEIFTYAIRWDLFPETSTVVDVGESLRTVSMTLARKFSHLKYIIQDLPQVIDGDAGTRKFWAKEYPEFVQSGKVQFQPHDFFRPNPVNSPDVFIMRAILHD
ncbi:hypothetical protein BDV98DRAFT_598196 [Pterulicium gracile]|uniref:Uncharacterized protein n=1 Tax=Pterulicium gracile TaxID=1884261 RepID=A0A5C3Q1H6_9AGAR|nr:hypothetical protein BDV98DRAFT_598196 [Pterula gracilis]